MPTAQYDTLKKSFVQGGLPEDLVTAVLDEYGSNKRRYFLNDYRPAAVDAGRFCEAVTRVIQFLGKDPHVPLTAEIKVDSALNKIENDMTLEEGLRLHVPRAIRLVYGVRNKRDTGHLKGGIDPSLQDATLVVSTLDWVLAELVRIAHGVTADGAQDLITGIVTKEVPLVAVYNGRPVLLTDLKHLDHILVVLYWASSGSVTRGQLALQNWGCRRGRRRERHGVSRSR
ncbi:hypothetical protein [Cellulomonas fimi]|uniref:Uncharacterized protein n=1 Tax=Cellulomonas fimi TaxID=1708 RepID=A0A7Y0M277_CELFI|nr:hypothetical protein [Cellulomonas fimi]NMR21733.1 hypothetical protein [Cellulomonas fimi]